jgi:enamine deaminase RidA (YjgF/YER057c/UK114 family)
MNEHSGVMMRNSDIELTPQSPAEQDEMERLGILSLTGDINGYARPAVHENRPPIEQRAVHVPDVLNEAYDYSRPSSFSRATVTQFGDYRLMLISGTASVDEHGFTIYEGDFRAQCWRTYRNITNLLAAENMSWHDIVRTTCYLRDIERDYKDFNDIRTAFFEWMELKPLPASTGIQARLCRDDLLVEMEAIAIARVGSQ